jgi:hypothetical protein
MPKQISNLPESVPIYALRGATLSFAANPTIDGVPFDWTGKTLAFTVRSPGTPTPVLALTSGAGITVAGSQVQVKMTAAQGLSIAAGSYVYNLVYQQGADVFPLMSGKFELRSEVAA